MNPCAESNYWNTAIFAQDTALMKYKSKQSILSHAIYIYTRTHTYFLRRNPWIQCGKGLLLVKYTCIQLYRTYSFEFLLNSVPISIVSRVCLLFSIL
jgi:hypothetical protein